ncbi:hypothetical protein [uncultured Aquimarina sp.]|uniref:hypothetical protein n=1 Tax=uncultured Aquimarina sp. TaxID=575652 RepID=UPI00263791E9|nr:hypothetical protein [uncultured Aquimarina sp.]
MSAYLTLIEIALLVFVIHKSYQYLIFKYRSKLVEATVKEIKEYEVFQTFTSKSFQGEKLAIKVTLEYEIEGKIFSKIDRITKDSSQIALGEKIQLRVFSSDPEQCSLKSDTIRFRNMILGVIVLLIWSTLTFVILKTSS